MPEHVPDILWTRLITLSRKEPKGLRVCHARRTVEMVSDLALKEILRKELKPLFTSTCQRKHTGPVKAPVARMDAAIATSVKTAALP